MGVGEWEERRDGRQQSGGKIKNKLKTECYHSGDGQRRHAESQL